MHRTRQTLGSPQSTRSGWWNCLKPRPVWLHLHRLPLHHRQSTSLQLPITAAPLNRPGLGCCSPLRVGCVRVPRRMLCAPMSRLKQVSCICHNPLRLLGGSFSRSMSHFRPGTPGKIPGGEGRTQRVRVLRRTEIRGKPGKTCACRHESQKQNFDPIISVKKSTSRRL